MIQKKLADISDKLKLKKDISTQNTICTKHSGIFLEKPRKEGQHPPENPSTIFDADESQTVGCIGGREKHGQEKNY